MHNYWVPHPDIDECIPNCGLGPCQQNCTNTIGSYFCSCSSGYNFVANESVCIGKVPQIECRVFDTINILYIIQILMNAPLTVVWVHVNKIVPTLLDHTSAAVVQDTLLEPIKVHALVRYWILYFQSV